MGDHIVIFAQVLIHGVLVGALGATDLLPRASFISSGAVPLQAPADAPLPEITPAQLATKIREAMSRYDDRGKFRVVFTDTHDMNFKFVMNQGKPEEQAPDLVSYRGRVQHESDGKRWRTECDSMIPSPNSPTRMWPDEWTAGFDGTQQYHWLVARNEFNLGEFQLSAREWTPRSIIWEVRDDLLSALEATDRSKFSLTISQRTVDGHKCYVVETKSADGNWGSETVVSPSQGYLAIARQWTWRGKTNSSRALQGVHEVVPGIWAPDRIETESITVRDDGKSRLSSRRRIQIVEYQPRQAPPDKALELKIPFGVDVVDRRQSSTYYHNNPWWPEVGAMLKEKFGWPKSDFSALGTLGSSPEQNFHGQPAPPLRIARWINSQPIELASLRGKVVLVVFDSVWDHYAAQYASALKDLYPVYHPAGLEILSIHAPTDAPDEIARFAREFRLPYPVVIDEGKPSSQGATAEAFAIRGRISAVLIDHEGNIHSAGRSRRGAGQVVETIVAFLQKAGARDVKAVSLEPPRLPQEAFDAADRLFNDAAKTALAASPPGKIMGRVVDGRTQPVEGASVDAKLQLTMLIMSSPGGYTVAGYRGPAERFRASSESDGHFEIAGLCKGTYLLRISAPGKAWTERKLFIGPGALPDPVEFVLDQGDSIGGQVRDQEGKPIARATVTPTARHHYEREKLRFIAHLRSEGVTTDDAGRFRFAELQEGRYVIKVHAAGFKDRELDAVPAGETNVVATLERAP
jgi:peroxiredoxin